MKRITCLVLILSGLALNLFSQAPNGINYQAVLRDGGGSLLENRQVGLQLSILQGGQTGTPVYVETHSVMTNNNGLVNVVIGSGSPTTGEFSKIDWSSGPFFIKTEADPEGGTGYKVSITSQLQSVPYALYAEKSGDGFDGDYEKLTNKPVLSKVAASGNYYDLQNRPQGIYDGDLLYWSDNNWQRLPLGEEGQVLAVSDGRLSWLDPSFGTISASTYRVGDIFYGSDGSPEGIMFELSTAGRYGKIVSLWEATESAWAVDSVFDISTYARDDKDGNNNKNTIKQLPDWQANYPAVAAAAAPGSAWYLPAVDELSLIYDSKAAINAKIEQIASDNPLMAPKPLNVDFLSEYWSSTEVDYAFAFCIAFGNSQIEEGGVTYPIDAGTVYECYKNVPKKVRPVRRLSWVEATSKPLPDKLYNIGDQFLDKDNKPVGIVVRITNGGANGTCISLDEDLLNWEGAKNWCSAKGPGWTLPDDKLLASICNQKDYLNDLLGAIQGVGAKPLGNSLYWTSVSDESGIATAISLGINTIGQDEYKACDVGEIGIEQEFVARGVYEF